MKRFLLILLLAGCADQPSRIVDGPAVSPPGGFWMYCHRNPTDPICPK